MYSVPLFLYVATFTAAIKCKFMLLKFTVYIIVYLTLIPMPGSHSAFHSLQYDEQTASDERLRAWK